MSIYYLGHPNVRYFEGDCAIFAIALHHISKKPLAALVEYSDEINQEVLIHAFVLLNQDGAILDASGESSINDVLNEFPHGGKSYLCLFNEEDLLKLAYAGKNIPDYQDAMPTALTIFEEFNNQSDQD